MPIVTRQPNLKLEEKTFIIYGRRKFGKSSIASQFPGVRFLATERGLDHLEVPTWEDGNGNYVITRWDVLVEATKELVADKDTRIIAIDIADNIYHMVAENIKETHGNAEALNADKLGYGVGYELLSSKIRKYIKALAAQKIGLIFISHERVEEENNVKRTLPSMDARLYNIVASEVDVILYGDFENSVQNNQRVTNRVFRTRPTALYEAGCRGPIGYGPLLPDPAPISYPALRDVYDAEVQKYLAWKRKQDEVSGATAGKPATK